MSPVLAIGCLGAYLLAARFSSQAFGLAAALSLFAVIHMAGGY